MSVAARQWPIQGEPRARKEAKCLASFHRLCSFEAFQFYTNSSDADQSAETNETFNTFNVEQKEVKMA